MTAALTNKRPHARTLAAMTCVVLVALLTMITSAQTTRSTPPPRSLFVAASADATWLARPSTGPAKDATKWSVLRRLTRQPTGEHKTDEQWTAVASLAQRPRAVASYGERLAVLYPDGTWSLVSPTGQSNGPAASSELKLVSVIGAPDRLTFLARPKGDDSDGVFLINFDGRELSEPRPANFGSGSAMAAKRIPTTRPGVAFVAELEALDEFQDVAQSADGQLHAFRTDGGATLVAADGSEAKIDLPAATLAGRLTLSQESDGSARFWWLEDENVVSRAFAIDGTAKDEPTTVTTRPPPSPPMFERGLYVVGALALLLVLLAGGRQTIAVTKALAAKTPPAPAPLARRLAAGVLDCFPLAATGTYLAAGGKLTMTSGMLRFDSHRSEAILAAGVLLYLMLLIACELRWNTSIGKRIFALRIVGIDGQSPRPRAILIRNVLRLVDLNLITLLIVPATPLRQRLGDFLAGTMVIDALRPDASNPRRVTPDDRADNT